MSRAPTPRSFLARKPARHEVRPVHGPFHPRFRYLAATTWARKRRSPAALRRTPRRCTLMAMPDSERLTTVNASRSFLPSENFAPTQQLGLALEPAPPPLRGMRVAVVADGAVPRVSAEILATLGAEITPVWRTDPSPASPASSRSATRAGRSAERWQAEPTARPAWETCTEADLLLLPAPGRAADRVAAVVPWLDWRPGMPIPVSTKSPDLDPYLNHPPDFVCCSDAAAGREASVDCTRRTFAHGWESVFCAGLESAIAALAALLRGSPESCAQALDGGPAPLDEPLYACSGRTPGTVTSPFFALLPAADGWVSASLLGDWTTLAHWAASEGASPWLTTPELESLPHRRSAARELFAELARWTQRYPAQWLTERAQLLRLPWAAVRPLAALRQDIHLRARDLIAPRAGAAEPAVQRAPLLFWRLPTAASGTAAPRDTPFPARGAAPRNAPLAGCKVLDFTWAVAGPLATLILSSLGASVHRVSHPSAVTQEFDAALAQWLATGKCTEFLDLSSPRARKELWQRAVRGADVMIDNFSPRVMEQWGFHPAHLLSEHPRCIVVRMPAFGLSGPYRDWVGFGPTLEAWSGYTASLGHLAFALASRFPVAFSDLLAALWAVLGVLAATVAQRRTGAGALVEVSQFDCLAFLLLSHPDLPALAIPR